MKAETAKHQKTTIVVAEHTPFEGDMKTNLVSSIEMAEIVSSLFSPAFADYYGCNIRINNGNTTGVNPIVVNSLPLGAIYVDVYFKDRGRNSSKAIKNLELRGQVKTDNTDGEDDKNSTHMAARFFAVNSVNNGANNGRVYDVTADTYEALEEFMFVRNVRWNDHTQEISANMGVIGSKEEAVVCISGLSLDKILTKIYGNKTEEGEFEYVATPSTMIPGRNNEFIMQVCQLNLAVVRKLHRDLGVNNPANPQFHVYR